MRLSSAGSLRLATAALVFAVTFGQLHGSVARADSDSCPLSQVGTKCTGDGGAPLFTTCLAITTTTTAEDGGMSNATAGGCVLISGTYCPPANESEPCGDAGDTCQVMNVATSSGSTGGGEQTSATSYSYGVCKPAPLDAGGHDDDGGTTSESSGDASTSTSGTSGADGGATSGSGGASGTGATGGTGASDSGATNAASSDSSDGGCTIEQTSNDRAGGAWALIAGVGLLGFAARRRRSPR